MIQRLSQCKKMTDLIAQSDLDYAIAKGNGRWVRKRPSFFAMFLFKISTKRHDRNSSLLWYWYPLHGSRNLIKPIYTQFVECELAVFFLFFYVIPESIFQMIERLKKRNAKAVGRWQMKDSNRDKRKEAFFPGLICSIMQIALHPFIFLSMIRPYNS